MSPTQSPRPPQGAITARQAEVLARFYQVTREQGYEPTAAELAQSLGTHPSASRSLFRPLITKGYLRKGRGARTVRLTPSGFWWLIEAQIIAPSPFPQSVAQPELTFVPDNQIPLFADPVFAPGPWEPAAAVV